MIKMLLLLNFVGSICIHAYPSEIGLDFIRTNYGKVVSNKSLCKKMIDEMEGSNLSSLKLAYLGAFQTIWANHVFNPFSKLSTFRKGKLNIEKAVKNENDNVEIRFIRLSIQINCPQFLGYNKNIEEDKLFLKSHVDEIEPDCVRKLAINIMMN